MNSLVDCQCGILHHLSILCVRGSCSCCGHPQVCVNLFGSLVSSEVHCCVDYAAHFLGETNCVKRLCCRGSINSQCAFKRQVTMSHMFPV